MWSLGKTYIDEVKMINKKGWKVNKWWLLRAWFFGKRYKSTDCEFGECITLYMIAYKGIIYVYKEEKFKEESD